MAAMRGWYIAEFAAMGLRRVGLAYGISLLGVLNAVLSNLWLMREVALKVPSEEYGLFIACSATIEYFNLVGVGVAYAFSLRVADALVRNDDIHARRIFHQLSWFNRGITAVAAVAVKMDTAVQKRQRWHTGKHIIRLEQIR